MSSFTRRGFLWVPLATVPGLNAHPGCGAPTTTCSEGPFYKPGAPTRQVLREAGMSGTRCMFSGRVLDAQCKPIAAVVDLWHSNATGEYDNKGFTLRGQAYTDRSGQFRFETILPQGYAVGKQFRPAHFHVKVHVQGKSPMTTELYFPGDPHNEGDFQFHASRLVKLENDGKGKAALFDFVLP